MQLLSSPEANPKTRKNAKVNGVLTAPLHLAPYKLSGWNVCPMASKGCAAACLHTAGNPLYMAAKEKARLARTAFYFNDRAAFLEQLAREIAAHERKAKREGLLPAIRLNATSDISWERHGIIEAFPRVKFYDYTKITKRALAWAAGAMPRNYHLTYSRSENNDASCVDVLNAGGNVAIVFDVARSASFPARLDFGGKLRRAVDGDVTDYRPSDGRGVIVALRAKGQAKGESSGFVLSLP